MNALDTLLDRLSMHGSADALVGEDQVCSHAGLRARCEEMERILDARGCRRQVVFLKADYGMDAVALLIALWRMDNTVALLTQRSAAQQAELLALSEAQWEISVDAGGRVSFNVTGVEPSHPLLRQLGAESSPGLVIFSSGSTGKPKAIVHRALPLLERHLKTRKRLRTIAFLLFDHIGGVNTLFYVLFNGGTLVLPQQRTPQAVAQAIERFRVQAMTTSPTFLNLMLLGGVFEAHDLSSLEIINYSSEPMPDSTLALLHQILPDTQLSQAYGMTEIGVIPARSRGSVSTWMKLGDADTELRIVDGMLEVRNRTTMMGYLSGESPITADGFYRTGDTAIQDGEYIKILGRSSDLINVGGEKVYPAEIESVLRELPNVADVLVSQEKNAFVGNLIKATFVLREPEEAEPFKRRLQQFCAHRLAPFQIPRKVAFSTGHLHNERFKKIRNT